jgi:hypothetical protein
MILFNTKRLEKSHQVGSSRNHVGFNMDLLGAAEKSAIANSLHDEKYCLEALRSKREAFYMMD